LIIYIFFAKISKNKGEKMDLKSFEKKFDKKKINFFSSFLLSFSLHALLGTIILYVIIFYKDPDFKPTIINKIKISLKSYKDSEKKYVEMKNAKKILNLNISKKKKLEDKTVEQDDENSSLKQIEQKDKKEFIYPNSGIKRSYGEDFFNLSPEEQIYIAKTWKRNNEINEIMSMQEAKDHNNSLLSINDFGTVIFYLNPDGTATDITLLNETNNTIFAETVKNTIYKSSKYYERPKTKTLMKIFINLEKNPFL
jgi:hypothetical protein